MTKYTEKHFSEIVSENDMRKLPFKFRKWKIVEFSEHFVNYPSKKHNTNNYSGYSFVKPIISPFKISEIEKKIFEE